MVFLQSVRIGFGISKGFSVQPNAFLVAMISSTPNGAPCVLDVPAKLGAPKPIFVLHEIKDGFLDFWAFLIAASISR